MELDPGNIIENLFGLARWDVINATVAEVNELARQTTLDLSLRLGNLIVDRFYGGDLGAWRRRGARDASFRRLAEHTELTVSASGIYRSVAVYELNERLIGVSRVKQLAVGHVRAVLSDVRVTRGGLDTAVAEQLLADVVSQHLGGERMAKRTHGRRAPHARWHARCWGARALQRPPSRLGISGALAGRSAIIQRRSSSMAGLRTVILALATADHEGRGVQIDVSHVGRGELRQAQPRGVHEQHCEAIDSYAARRSTSSRLSTRGRVCSRRGRATSKSRAEQSLCRSM